VTHENESARAALWLYPLSPPAVALLRDLPRGDDNPFILPGKLPGAHLVNVDSPWRRVRTAAGVADVRLHDLRVSLTDPER